MEEQVVAGSFLKREIDLPLPRKYLGNGGTLRVESQLNIPRFDHKSQICDSLGV